MKRCNSCLNLIDDECVFCPLCGYKEGNPPKELFQLYPGTVLLDRYIIGKVLGVGGFGITYRAWDKKLDTIVAIKEFYPISLVNRVPGTNNILIYNIQREKDFYAFKEKFLDEARNMAKFNSESNIVNVYKFFEENDTAYIVMEFLEGECLSDYLKAHNRKIELDYAVKVIEEIANALSKLHKHGIIHRDISPDNIFICNDGKIKLIDFGAARFSYDENKKLTVILKHGFAPPEQYEWINKQGAWTDVYALGATLYLSLTGKKPVKSTNRRVKDTLPPPNEINPDIPDYISNTIMKAMSVDINFRFKNVDDFVAGLRQKKFVAPVAVEKKKAKKKRSIGIALSLSLIVIGLVVSSFLWIKQKNEGTLSECDLVMWYCKSGDKELDKNELQSYKNIISEFNKSYPAVKIDVVGFEENEYKKILKNGGKQPNIYEYLNIDSGTNHLSLEEIYNSENFNNYTLLNQVNRVYGCYDYLPLGFVCPIIFADSEKVEYDKNSVSSLKDMFEYGSFATDCKDFSKIFTESNTYYNVSASDMFFSNQIFFYGTKSSNYLKVSRKMTAQYKLIYCGVPEVCCWYSNVWTANDIDKKENKAALKLLEFMLNENGQDILHIRNKSESFPINDRALDLYVDVYGDFNGFFENKDNYIFERQEL